MIEMGKECGFPSNFDMPLPFYLAQNARLPNGLLYPRVEVEQRTRSGDDIVTVLAKD